MEAKNTVMTEDDIQRKLANKKISIVASSYYHYIVAEAQAQVTWDKAKEYFLAQGRKEAVEWVKSNAIYSHEPACEHIQINRYEWNDLEGGRIPKERDKVYYKEGTPSLQSGG